MNFIGRFYNACFDIDPVLCAACAKAAGRELNDSPQDLPSLILIMVVMAGAGALPVTAAVLVRIS